MTTRSGDRQALDVLDARLRSILPAEYQDSYEELEPVPMRSAGLKYGADGRVAWNQIWGSFCDLAMAGGPPHKGSLLEPAVADDIAAAPDRYETVLDELCRGVWMVTELEARDSPSPGWIRVACLDDVMAGWLVRAIVMENIAARHSGRMLELPAAPHFRLEKEIKNVVTVIAKTCHYWLGHMPGSQHRKIATLFASLANERPLVEPVSTEDGRRSDVQKTLAATMADGIEQRTHRSPSTHEYAGWLGVEYATARAAIWMMRALVVSNVLSRREGTVLFVPINPIADPDGTVVVNLVARVHELAVAARIL